MKYAIIKCSNATFTIDSEWTDLTKAKVQFQTLTATFGSRQCTDGMK